MQQEYIPYGPEWAKEIKKFTKDEIIDNLLRPALLKANAEPGQSAGTWVKASERLPAKTHNYYTKEKAFNGVIYNSTMFFHTEVGWAGKSEVLEWLDQSALPDNKDREIAFHKWVTENEYEINNRAQITHSIEQLHEIWEISLTNNK